MWDFLGTIFYQENGEKLPNYQQVLDGIVKEHCLQTIRTEEGDEKKRAEFNIAQTWKILFSKANVANQNEPIDESDLKDPNSNIA